MKPIFILCAALSSFLLFSCGSRKASSPGDGDYQYQKWLAQQRAAGNQGGTKVDPVIVPVEQTSSRPKRKMRDEDPCVELAIQDSPYIRSFGTAVGYMENAVMDHALMQAQEMMSILLQNAIETAAKNYVRNGEINLDNTGAGLYESMAKRFSANTAKNTKIIKKTTYDLDNGQVQIYVCIENREANEVMKKKLANELSREGLLRTQQDRDRFEKEMDPGLQAYKAGLEKNSEIDN